MGQIETLPLLLSQMLGPVPVELEASVRALIDPLQIQTLLRQLMAIHDWETLRTLLLSPR